jgi:class 3 adenylate cyclase
LPTELIQHSTTGAEDGYHEIQLLAERLQAVHGDLDDMAIMAIVEATGAPEAYVRLVAASATPKRKASAFDQVRTSFRAMTPEARTFMLATVFATGAGLFQAVATASSEASSLGGMLAIVSALCGLAVVGLAKHPRHAAGAGALLGGVMLLTATLFGFLFGLVPGVVALEPSPWLLLPFLFLGSFAGLLLQRLVQANRGLFGLKDPFEERQLLLRQLQDLQERLRSDARNVTFLSVDIVGSTAIKAANDHLDVEYSFGQYHEFVAAVVTKFQGQVHSTAGDGVTAVFEDPVMGYRAGRALIAGLFEFNSFRNKLREPVEVRCGVHTGTVHAPGEDYQRVSFAEVIDIAAHMQKVAEPGTVVVSETTAAALPEGLEGLGGEVVHVHGLRAARCRPAALAGIPALSKPVGQ